MAWEDRWTQVRRLRGGGQGDAYLVTSTDSPHPRFLKTLRHNQTERRDRMRREIACYRTLTNSQIPTLIDSDVDSPVPYLVTEFIEGPNLSEYVERNGPIAPAEAIELTCNLLSTLEYAHSQETVHRDIKPDNIILRQGNHTDPVLVDFGMSFYEGEEQLTPGQEIGNRFLRLPEFNVGSSNPRDPRSDVTQAAGVLFYLLTNQAPRGLRNHDGHAPHQTPAARAILQRLTGIDLLSLLNVFDRAFDLVIHARWNTAAVLRAKLREIRLGQDIIPNMNQDEMLARIAEQMQSHDEVRIAKVSERLKKVGKLIENTHNQLGHEMGFSPASTSLTPNTSQLSAEGQFGLLKPNDQSVGYWANLKCVLEGEELVLFLDAEPFYRTQADIPRPEEVVYVVREILIRGVNQLFG